MLFGCARAEGALDPDNILSAYASGQPVTCTVTADLTALPGVSDPALEALKGFIGRLKLVMDVQSDDEGESAGFTLMDGENALFTVGQKTADGVTASYVGGEWFLTPADEKNALSVLGSAGFSMPYLKAKGS